MSKRSGIALFTTLIMAVVLLMMILSLVLAVRGENYLTFGYKDRVSSLYVAESGVAEALDRLGLNRDWNTDLVNQPMLGGEGTYTIDFDDGGGVEAWESVNNLSGGTPVDGPRGPDTVPPNTADIVVTARVGGVQRRLEVLIQGGGSLLQASSPLQASGKIRMKGSVDVDGITALDDRTPVPGGIHSTNQSGSPGTLIEWDSLPGDVANITGTVGVENGGASPFDWGLGTANLSGSPATESNASSQAFPSVNITAEIGAKTGAPAPVINPGGATVLTGPGDYYYGALDLAVPGDLILQDGANLYVAEGLEVQGSISGDGSVWVGKETRFKGDAALTTGNALRTAVFSKGGISLTGFDGTEYMETLAASNPTVATSWNAVTATLSDLQNYISTYPASDLVVGGARYGDVDQMRRTLGQDGGPGWAGRGNDHFYKLWDELENNLPGPSPTKDFMARKLRELDLFFDGKSRVDNFTDGPAVPNATVIADWTSETYARYGGWFDGVIDGGDLAVFTSDMIPVTRSVDYTRLGSSYFQGVLYTNGYVYCDNEITVIGALMARNDGSQGPTNPDPTNPGLVLEPGEIYLGNDSSLTYVEEFFDDEGQGGGGGALRATVWLGR